MKLIFATRASTLARWQTRSVMQSLQTLSPSVECEERILTTKGDRIIDHPLPEIGGKGVFTEELESAILEGKVQLAVHSLKDLPVEERLGLVIGAIPARADARDVLVSSRGFTLETLPEGAHIGTSSLRRSAQLLNCRPDLVVEPLRGNVETRLHKALDDRFAAIILAGAGLARLGLENTITEWLSTETMLPAPGQGALAVECRADDQSTLKLLGMIEDQDTRRAVMAEREFLRHLGGGCSLPVGAYARIDGSIHLDGVVASPDGRRLIRVSGEGNDPLELGSGLAEQAFQAGADQILSAFKEAS